MNDEWDGIERRHGEHAVSLEAIQEILYRLDAKFVAHMKEEEALKPHLIELVNLLQRSKGALTLLKVLIYIGALLAAFLAWAKDHIKL